MNRLKEHPFAVDALFERSLVLTFAVLKEEVAGLIPPCLSLDTHQDKWAFIAVAMVQTKNLRPKGFPKFMGSDFFLIGYRVFVRYTNAQGKRLRGLYILKSETDSRRMTFFGNMFTEYRYTTTDIQQQSNTSSETISSSKSQFQVRIRKTAGEVALPEGSVFQDWKEARRFAGPLPFTFTYDAGSKKVLIIEGLRENWDPKPVDVASFNFNFLDTLGLSFYKLANAFAIYDIPYHWKKGKVEQWK